MKLKTLTLHKFKGVSVTLGLGDRDLLLADNMVGKTAVVQAIAFLATGKVPGMKSDDRIDLISDESMFVTGCFERDNGSIFSFERGLSFIDGKLSETFEIVPSGGEKSLKKANERLASECSGNPFAVFDLPKFMGGNERTRLDALMGLCRGEMDTFDDAVSDHFFESVGDVATHAKAKDELLNIPCDGTTVLEGCEFYGDMAKTRASDHRKESVRLEHAIRELGHVGSEDLAQAGDFLGTIDENLSESKAALDAMKEERAAASERRGEVQSLKDRLESLGERAGQFTVASKELMVSEAKADVVKAAEKLSTQKALAVEASGGQDDAESTASVFLANAQADLEFQRSLIKVIDGDVEHLTTRKQGAQTEHSNLGVAMRTRQKQMDFWKTLTSDECPVCRRGGLSKEVVDGMIAQVTSEMDNLAQDQGHVEAEIQTIETSINHENTRRVSQVELVGHAEEEVRRTESLIASVASDIQAIQANVGSAQASLDNARRYHVQTLSTLAGARDTIAEIEHETGELQGRMTEVSANLPKDVEEGAIEGAEQRVATLEADRDNARDIQRRYDDQAKLREQLGVSNEWVKAFEAWQRGFLDLMREWLEKFSDPVMTAAKALVKSAIGQTLHLDFLTARGKPGLTIGIEGERGKRRWPAMSGAEQSVVGLALALAMTSASPPLLLTAECEAMTGRTQEKFLGVVAKVGGSCQFLFTTHHSPVSLGMDDDKNPEWNVIDLTVTS